MNAKINFGILLLILFVSSCISDFNADMPSTNSDMLVVNGDIVANTNVTFYISKTFPLSSKEMPVESKNIEATVFIIGSNGFQSQPAKALGKGAYQLMVGDLDENTSYGIKIEYNGDTYTSDLSKPLSTSEIDSVTYNQHETYGDVFFYISTHNSNPEPTYFMWNYKEDWEINATYYTVFFFNPANKSYYTDLSAPFYYCWRKDISHQIMVGSTESLIENRLINRKIFQKESSSDRFSVLYSLLLSQKSISKESYEYYLNKVKLNEDMGGLFTPQPSEVEGNIHCETNPEKKVIGFINVSKNLMEKRIFISASQIHGERPYNTSCMLIPHEEVNSILKSRGITLSEFYSSHRPAGYSNENNEPIEWSTIPCTNCIERGGSKDKPDFWPNDHK